MNKRNFKKNKSLFRREVRSKKDFAWQAARANPYSREVVVSLKQKLELFILILLGIATVGFLLYHPYFQVQNVNVDGLKRISQSDFMDAVHGATQYSSYLVLPNTSYLIIDPDELEEVLKAKFALASIEVEKKFPHSLNIHVEEEISTIIYDNGKEYCYLGLDGAIVEKLRKTGDDEWLIETEIVTSTDENGEIIAEEKEISRMHILPLEYIINEMGDYPIIYDTRAKEGNVNEIILGEKTTKGILNWYNLLKKKIDITKIYFMIENEVGDAEIVNPDGYNLKIKLDERVLEQLAALDILLEKQPEIDSAEYIDLRYPDRVYWR